MSELETPVGRPVRVMSLGFAPTPDVEAVAAIIDREARSPVDLVALPETWHATPTSEPQTLEGPAIACMRQAARRNCTYIVCPLDRTDGRDRWNSAVLIDRGGDIVGVYDKVYVFWDEFKKRPPVRNGSVVPVFPCDFGRVGLAICFDVNFPEPWQLLARQGAELVIWPSFYSAGTSLQAHALMHHYYIVTSTQLCDCAAFDITGRQILYQQQPGLNVARVTVDLDRGIYHQDSVGDKLCRLLAEHAGEVEAEPFMSREGWHVVRARKPGVSVRALARQYGIEDLRDYIPRSQQEIDVLRGEPPRPMNGLNNRDT
jgi:predicted amidohydrolase